MIQTNSHRGCFQNELVMTPAEMAQTIPLSHETNGQIQQHRQVITQIIQGQDPRLLVVIGPCSIHDVKATYEYATRLAKLHKKFQDQLYIVMRVYLEKPRTGLGWKGFISDPTLTGAHEPNQGLLEGRRLLQEISQLGLPIGTEFLNPYHAPFLQDFMSWGAIGARTSESQSHRELASGLPCPVGFKNRTDGNVQVAVDAIQAASASHQIIQSNMDGRLCFVKTAGNHGHLILRGGITPNYEEDCVQVAQKLLQAKKITSGIMIDCSHANSQKQHKKQKLVVDSILQQLQHPKTPIMGVMLESFLVEGKQAFDLPSNLKYGQSITDACLGWQESEALIALLAQQSMNKDKLARKICLST
jgi:3-deoxy-7-phosphoheptulonate synthase